VNKINTTITPVQGDIYYYETMEELDAHEVEGDRRRARMAMLNARLVGLLLIGLIAALLYVFRFSPMLQVLSVVGTLLLLLSWYLYDLLELCDD
jgi:membrane-bound ClpP family serine protease